MNLIFKNFNDNETYLSKALEYRQQVYPIIEALLNPQNLNPLAKDLQRRLELDTDIQEFDIDILYQDKAIKSKILSEFIDEIFCSPQNFNLSFFSPPSMIDKKWTKQLLIYDFIYYGPVTILSIASILEKMEDLRDNPLFLLLNKDVHYKKITEIRVNNFKDIYYEATNKIFEWQLPFISNDQLEMIIQRIISETNLLNKASIKINSSCPIADFEHPCGFIRGSALISPAVEAPCMTLRIHPGVPYGLEDLMNYGMFSQEMKNLFLALQEAGTTIAIAGTMGSGKTTLLSALAEHWPNKGRKATIEDTPELRPNITDLVKMRTIDFERVDLKNIDVTRLTKACKRHSIRYVVLSEARDGSAWEILQLSQAILGCLMTYHYTLRSNKYLVDQALNTLVALCKQNELAPKDDDLKHLVASMVQILVMVEQSPLDNIRRVTKIYFITGFDEMNGGHFKFIELFSFNNDKGFYQVNKCTELEDYLNAKGVNFKFNSI